MKAMMLKDVGQPLTLVDIPIPIPSENEVLIRVHTCGVCRTDLHVIDGDLKQPCLPLILGHQIVGTIVKQGANVSPKNYPTGLRIGIPWLQGCCETCSWCASKRENLCDKAVFTGYTHNGGFAEYCTANASFCFPLAENYSDIQAAPLLCAGLIGWRALKMTKNAEKIGFFGFGSSAHILTQIANYQKKKIFAFTREHNDLPSQLAKKLGVHWCGSSNDKPDDKLQAAIIFASAGSLVPKALSLLDKGGIIVCAGIHMSDIPSFPYSLLWEEREIKSVANLTSSDGHDFFEIAAKIPIQTTTTTYSLEQTNDALNDLRSGHFAGSAVIVVS